MAIRTNAAGGAAGPRLEAAIAGILIGCIYLPNGNPQPGPKFDYKLAWFKRLQTHGQKLLREGVPVLLAGDFNVAPKQLRGTKTRLCNPKAALPTLGSLSKVGPMRFAQATGKSACTHFGTTCEIAGKGMQAFALIISF